MLNISNKYFGQNALEEASDVTNKYFGKKESEEAMDVESKNQTVNEDKGNNEHPSTLIDGSDDVECAHNLEELPGKQNNEDQTATVSIDVTKALLLLGINSWSDLEPGKGKHYANIISSRELSNNDKDPIN